MGAESLLEVGEDPGMTSTTVVLDAAWAVARGQLPTGEVATFFPAAGSGLEYLRSPMLSALVHGALACLDPTSAWVATEIIDRIPPAKRASFVRGVARVRSRIRRFLAWEEHADGTWRFLGRGSGVPPEIGLTACAAAALLECPRRGFRRPWERHLTAIRRLRASGVGATDLHGLLQELRFRALAGDDVSDLLEDVLRRLTISDTAARSQHGTVTLAYAVASTWRETCLPGGSDLRGWLLPRLLDVQNADGSFGGPISTAMALSALLDLEHVATETERTRNALLARARPGRGWSYEPFLPRNGGAPAATSAFAIAALTRSWTLLG
jgi:hypothetical protein